MIVIFVVVIGLVIVLLGALLAFFGALTEVAMMMTDEPYEPESLASQTGFRRYILTHDQRDGGWQVYDLNMNCVVASFENDREAALAEYYRQNGVGQ